MLEMATSEFICVYGMRMIFMATFEFIKCTQTIFQLNAAAFYGPNTFRCLTATTKKAANRNECLCIIHIRISDGGQCYQNKPNSMIHTYKVCHLKQRVFLRAVTVNCMFINLLHRRQFITFSTNTRPQQWTYNTGTLLTVCHLCLCIHIYKCCVMFDIYTRC